MKDSDVAKYSKLFRFDFETVVQLKQQFKMACCFDRGVDVAHRKLTAEFKKLIQICTETANDRTE